MLYSLSQQNRRAVAFSNRPARIYNLNEILREYYCQTYPSFVSLHEAVKLAVLSLIFQRLFSQIKWGVIIESKKVGIRVGFRVEALTIASVV